MRVIVACRAQKDFNQVRLSREIIRLRYWDSGDIVMFQVSPSIGIRSVGGGGSRQQFPGHRRRLGVKSGCMLACKIYPLCYSVSKFF